MHIISRKVLREFGEIHADSKGSLDAWFHEAGGSSWANSAEVKAKYGSASIINAERVVFDICGGNYRLLVRINYMSETIFIRFIGTHAKYDRIDAETF
jgi:mRNA interferase HigB